MVQNILQFKITLQYITPIIWRRIQIPDSYTFWDLHVAIQDAMGWTDSHLHEFYVINPSTSAKEHIGFPDEEGDSLYETLAGWETKLKDYIKTRKNQKIRYLYDFGDSWEHIIEYEGEQEKQSTKYPICLAGERHCPPEDIGGLPGYENFISIIQDPGHEEHDEFLQWVGGHYDPEKFDAKQVKFDNPKIRLKNAFS